MKNYYKFGVPTVPIKEMSNYCLNQSFYNEGTLYIRLTAEEEEFAKKNGFLEMSPKRSVDKKIIYRSPIRIILNSINTPLKFTYIEDKGEFVFDIINEFKNLKPSIKNKFKKIFKEKGVATSLLGLAHENNYVSNISPVKFSCALITDEKELTNLSMKRIIGDYFSGVAFVTEEELKEYKNKLIPAYIKWLETGIFEERSVKVKMKKSWHVSFFENNEDYQKREGLFETYYFNKDKGFLFDENTGYCKRLIERIDDTNIFKVSIFYKTGELKLVNYQGTMEGKDRELLSGQRQSSFLVAEKGIGSILYNRKQEIVSKTYYGISGSRWGFDFYSDYTKSFNRFFNKIEKTFEVNLSLKEKEKLVEIFYRQKIINVATIEKSIRENNSIEMESYENLEDFVDFLELFFSC